MTTAYENGDVIELRAGQIIFRTMFEEVCHRSPRLYDTSTDADGSKDLHVNVYNYFLKCMS